MKLDLHGTKHEDVERKMDIFLWNSIQRNHKEVEVITGISSRMKNIVINICNDYGFKVNEKYFNPGCLLINLI